MEIGLLVPVAAPYGTREFVHRLGTKGVLRVYEVVFVGLFSRFFKTAKRGEIAVQLQMGDERVIAHMD